jgi:tetratricopeptide (TPR) repeat protein
LAAAAIFVFIVALIPTSGLLTFEFQQYSTVTDRYVYLAILGPSLLVAWAIAQSDARHRLLMAAVCGSVFLAWFAKTVDQIGYWRTDSTLFEHTVEVNPNSWMGYENLAFGLLQIDQAASIRAAEQALRLHPACTGAYTTMATANFIQGDRPAGIRQLRAALAINPNDFATHRLLAAALDKSGDTAAALREYNISLRLAPDDAATHSDLAACLADAGRLSEAIEQYREALAINPRFPNAIVGLEMAQRLQNAK